MILVLLLGLFGLTTGCLAVHAEENCRCVRADDRFVQQVAQKVIELQEQQEQQEQTK